MDKSWMDIYDRINDIRYEAGVIEFLDFAYRGRDESLAIPCPCKSCNNFRDKNRETMYNHLMQNGITRGYTTWNYHGEESDDDDGGGGDDVPFDGSDDSGTTVGDDMQLQRLFIDKQVASDMRWHKEKRVRDDNIARHPADTEAWKHLDKIDPPISRCNAYECTKKEDFTLRAALLWTINDFLAYGMLSGWSVKGYNACPTCRRMSLLLDVKVVCLSLADDEKEDYVGGKTFKPSTSAWMNRRRLILEQQHESYFCWKHENENSTSSPPVWLLDLWRNTSNGTGVFIPRTRTGVFIPRTAGTRKGNKPSRKLTPRERRYNRMIKF
ncbi:Myb domain protein 62 [Tanacetum coccineum]